MIDGAETPESVILPPQETTPSSPDSNKPSDNKSAQPENPPLSTASKQTTNPIKTQESTETKEIPFNNQQLINFLEKQKYPIAEDQSLTPDQKQRQQEFNEEIDDLIDTLTEQSKESITSDTFIQALNFGYQRSLPEQIEKIDSLINQATEELNKLTGQDKENLEHKINQLRQIKQDLEKELETQAGIPEEVKDQIKALFNKLDDIPQLKQQLITSLNNGDFDQIGEIFLNYNLQEKETDNNEIKNVKKNGKKFIETIKNYSLPIGGVFGIILLLMILRSSQQGNSGGNPLG